MKNKQIINSLFLCFLILTFCIPGFSSEKYVQSQWASTPIIIDGADSDWEGGALTLNKKTQVDYAFRNDANNLYVLFVFNDPRQFMSTIREAGITLWLNPDGGKKKKYGVRFSIKTVSADNYITILEEVMSEPMPEEKKQEIRSKESYQIFHNEVVDKKGEAPEIVSGPAAPAFNTAGGREVLTYEFRVPLKKNEEYPVGIGTEPGNTLSIGFEWGGSTKEMRQQKITSQTARGSSGRGTGASGSLTGETRTQGTSLTGGLGSMSRLRALTYSFWADVKLAISQ